MSNKMSDGLKPPHLVLASASPRRLEMLESLGIVPRVCPTDVNETPVFGETPEDLVLRLARTKAAAVKDAGDLCVLAADTVVVLNDKVLGKPLDEQDAREMWKKLSGVTHRVVTGVVLRMSDGREEMFAESTDVTFRPLSNDDIDAQIAAGRWKDKAGGYAIQSYAAAWVERVSGSYTNVVGLPLAQVVQALYRLHPHWPALPWRRTYA